MDNSSSIRRPFVLAAAVLALSLAGCKGEVPVKSASADTASKNAGAAGAAAPARPDPLTVLAEGELAQRLVVGELRTGAVAESIRIAGRLEVNQYKTARIGAPITGRISAIDALVGQQVKQGQVLAELNSPELAQAQLAYLRAHSQQQLNTRAVERAQLLLSADVIGSAELQRRQNELEVSMAEKRAASDQLRALGLSPASIRKLEQTGQIQPSAAITATLSGVVIDRRVAQGQVVNPADVLFVISDLSLLWAQAEVPEQDAQFVSLGQRVEVEIPALDGERMTGKVSFVSDLVNPETRTVRIGVDLDNRFRRLKPAMLITMAIEGRSAKAQLVPVTAVVRDNDRDHVYVQTAPGRFKLTPVRLGPERDGKRPLLDPLPDDVKIVRDGAFHLDNVRAQRALAG